MAGRLRRLRWWIAGAAVVVVAAAVGGPYVYIHFVEGPAPAKLQLPGASSATSTTTASSATTTGTAVTGAAGSSSGTSLNGGWNVGSGSIVGYRVQEVLVGQNATAVGRTSKVWGSIDISGTSVTKATFTADMASVSSDQSQRNSQFDGRIMDVSAYPTATFVLTDPIALGGIPAAGTIKQYPATGNLTLHGVTKPVTFTVSTERVGSRIDVLAEIPILFSNWNIANPSIGGFVTTHNSGTLEVLLDLTQGTGNPVAVSSSGSAGGFGGGGGGQVTIPATTLPPLTVPAG